CMSRVSSLASTLRFRHGHAGCLDSVSLDTPLAGDAVSPEADGVIHHAAASVGSCPHPVRSLAPRTFAGKLQVSIGAVACAVLAIAVWMNYSASRQALVAQTDAE